MGIVADPAERALSHWEGHQSDLALRIPLHKRFYTFEKMLQSRLTVIPTFVGLMFGNGVVQYHAISILVQQRAEALSEHRRRAVTANQ